MLCLLFQLGDALCALDANQLAEVLTFVKLRPIDGAPPGIAGVFDYRGAQVVVADACRLHLGCPAKTRLSTRILVFEHPTRAGEQKLIGVIVERATEALPLERENFKKPGRFGPIAETARGPVQFIELDRLVPDEVCEQALALATGVHA
ncbi:MAG: chemotaxis protein CheW [Verrucomicrobia bacterium]|nr:chemotaxis protein CheW [Verrucomicrobiota bacterium]